MDSPRSSEAVADGWGSVIPAALMGSDVRISRQPVAYRLHPCVPNPFNPQTTIRYDLAEGTDVQAAVYNVSGQQVRTLVSAHQEAGKHQVVWDGRDALGQEVSSGIYVVRMVAGAFVQSHKMLLLK